MFYVQESLFGCGEPAEDSFWEFERADEAIEFFVSLRDEWSKARRACPVWIGYVVPHPDYPGEGYMLRSERFDANVTSE